MTLPRNAIPLLWLRRWLGKNCEWKRGITVLNVPPVADSVESKPVWKNSKPGFIVGVVLILLIAFGQLIFTAWISDDAGITFRTVLNFVYGYGPVYNIAERVQAYTHPLWFLLLTLGELAVGNILLASHLLSFILSLGTLLILLFLIKRDPIMGILSTGLLLFSKSYVDFSSSGLENPLSHFLTVVAIWLGSRAVEQKCSWTSLGFVISCSSLMLSRMDLVIVIAPFAVWVLHQTHRSWSRTGIILLCGMCPIIVWSAFSLLYYGLLVPNTAYAKLNTGLSLQQRLVDGFEYLVVSSGRDLVLMLTIGSAVYFGWRATAREQKLVLGILLYIGYIFIIGGDFMGGRFLTVPFLVAVVLFSGFKKSAKVIGTLVIIFLVGAFHFRNVIIVDADKQDEIMPYGVADERCYYFQSQGLMPLLDWSTDISKLPDFEAAWRNVKEEHRRTVVATCIGYTVLGNGPMVHIIDDVALADPLLSHLKPQEYSRVGHWVREIPAGYVASIEENKNLLKNEELRDFYDEIRLITRGNLFDPKRLQTILRFQFRFGCFTFKKKNGDEPDVKNNSKLPPLSIMASSLSDHIIDSGEWNAPGNYLFPSDRSGIEVVFPTQKVSIIDCSFDNNDRYRLEYFDGKEYRFLFDIGPGKPVNPGGMVRYIKDVSNEIPAIDRIRIKPVDGDNMYSIGHFFVNREFDLE